MDFIAGLHPKVIHFPIVLFLTYSLFEIAGIVLKKDFLSKSAFFLLIMAVMGAIAAVLTGDQAAQMADKWADLLDNTDIIIPLGAIENHEEFANITMWYFAAVAVLRIYLTIRKRFDGWLKYSFIVLALIGCFLVYQTALLGGRLVYHNGVGTELVNPEKINKKNIK
ncbi:MAG: DUF2231 domain-containing protein [Syntrophothermus sp.]